MVVLHSLKPYGYYMFIGFVIFCILSGLLLIYSWIRFLYDLIYQYVSDELDQCNYFGTNNE